MLNVLVIPVDVGMPVYMHDLGDDEVVQIKRAQELVKGGHNVPAYFERIRTPIEGLVMYVNELGLLMHLPRNLRAEDFYPGTIVGQAFLTYEQAGEWVGMRVHDKEFSIERFNNLRMTSRSRITATRRVL